MTIATRQPRMTRDEFLDWVQTRGGRWEFDGFAPVAMTGGTLNHSRITQNIYAALRGRLRGGLCEVLGPDAGLALPNEGLRYPDALVTCTRGRGAERHVPGVVIVFEVLSPSSGRIDRIVKLREYAGVETIRRYVILEHNTPALTLFERGAAGAPWTATPLTEAETLPLPEIGVGVPVAEFFEGLSFAPSEGGSGQPGD